MVWIGRVLFLLTFALFWGGLTFYTGFVVRIAHDQLADPMEGGLITQRVTAVLQLIGAVVVVMMAWNAAVVFVRSKKLGAVLATVTGILALAIVGLFVVHGHLDAVIDREAFDVTDRDAFVIGHRRYNQLTTVEWIASITYLGITVFAWKKIDSADVEKT